MISHDKQKSNHAPIMADVTTPEILYKDEFDEVFYNFLSGIKRYGDTISEENFSLNQSA